MTLDGLLATITASPDWGPPLFRTAERPVAHRVVDYSETHVRLRAIGDDHIISVPIEDVMVVEQDVCHCGDLGCAHE